MQEGIQKMELSSRGGRAAGKDKGALQESRARQRGAQAGAGMLVNADANGISQQEKGEMIIKRKLQVLSFAHAVGGAGKEEIHAIAAYVV